MSLIKWSFMIGCLTSVLWAADRPGKDNYCLSPDGLALLGYSPVSYFQRNKAELGNPAFAVTHQGVTYHFTDAEQVGLFKANPSKYEPAHGGWCSVMMGSSGGRAMANPEAFKIVNGRLMLFYRGKTKQGAMVDGLQIWNSRKSESALLRKADKQWAQFLAGKRKSPIADVGDSAIPERLRKKAPDTSKFKAFLPGNEAIHGSRLKAFSATYNSQFGKMTLSLSPSSDVDGSATHNVLVELQYPNAVLVENYILKQASMETRYSFRPLISGPSSHYLAAFFDGKKVRGSRTFFMPKENESINATFQSPVIEAQLAGYVLATMDLRPGLSGKLPCYDVSQLTSYWRTFEVKPMETLKVAGKTHKAWPVRFDAGTSSEATVWVTREAPYVLKRERLVSGSKVVQELQKVNIP